MNEKEILALEDKRFGAMIARDFKALDAMLHGDLAGAPVQGVRAVLHSGHSPIDAVPFGCVGLPAGPAMVSSPRIARIASLMASKSSAARIARFRGLVARVAV